MAFQMNKQRERHMGEEGGGGAGHGMPHPHSVHIHHAGEGEPHPDNPHHVHVHHADGSHEHSEHGSFHEALNHAKSKASGGMGGEDQHPEETGGEEGFSGNVY